MPADVDARVIENRRLSSDYNVLEFHAPSIAAAAAPGQFVMIRTAGAGGAPLLRRPFSIFQVLRDGSGAPAGISILNKKIGTGTSQIYEARVDAVLPVLGPLGRPFVPPASGEAWMVAGGVGLGPFVTLAEALRDAGTPATLFYGARTAADLHCADLFPPLGAELVAATEDGTRGDRERITAPLERALRQAQGEREPGAGVTLYACGPTPMMRAVADLATRFDCRCVVSLEQVMGCGMGGCYSCVVKVRQPDRPRYVRSCIDGPVFDATSVIWEELTH
ncbi:MAG TPA: dihydroorotate dehydrogenase electron transfer subunit [Vicinamibacterales bacterium]|nr:dihydroorotate dehydrogenase electron transfer subunit [Vicinamibacterales bacterium]